MTKLKQTIKKMDIEERKLIGFIILISLSIEFLFFVGYKVGFEHIEFLFLWGSCLFGSSAFMILKRSKA